MLFGIQLEKTSTGFFFDFLWVNLMKKLKKDLVSVISTQNQIKKDEITQIVDTVLNGIKEILSEGSSLELRGFGTFEVKVRKAKANARNPKNGEKVETKPHYVVCFKPGIELKENIKKLEVPEK